MSLLPGPAQCWAMPILQQDLVLGRMGLSSWALQKAEVSTFQGLAFLPQLETHSRRKAWASPPGLHRAGKGQGVGTDSLPSAGQSSWSFAWLLLSRK